jgi:hypothetical protein
VTAPRLPASADEIDASWLAQATGLRVREARLERFAVGIGVASALYRARLEGEGCPPSVVVKLPALDEAARFTSTVLQMYRREVGFFTALRHMCPVRTPRCWYGDVDDAGAGFVLVLEDLDGMRVVDQNAGMTPDDAGRAVDGLAAMQARWWGGGEALAAAGTTISLGDPIYPAILPTVFREGWDKVTGEMTLPASILAIGPRFPDAVAPLLASLVHGPQTLAHGDYRADNLLFGPDDELAVLDFQLIGSGTGAYDLAYLVTQSLDADVASRMERELFARWMDGLRAGGVSRDALDERALWGHYRTAALFCLAYPVVASRGMDLADPRQRALVGHMSTRFDRAVTELRLADLL